MGSSPITSFPWQPGGVGGIFLDGDVKYGGGDILVKKIFEKKIIEKDRGSGVWRNAWSS